MKTLSNYSPKIKIISLILTFLIAFYLIPTSVYADGINDATLNGSASETKGNNSDGLENYNSTATHSAGAGGVGSINLATGKLTLAIPTLTTTDSLFAFTPTLVYNSSLAGKDVTSEHVDVPFATSYMPKGFKLNIQEAIMEKSYTDEDDISHTYYSLYDSDGTTHLFYSDGEDNTKYYDDSGLRLTLTFSGGNALIEDTSKTIRTYSMVNDSAWHLTDITDKYGNKLIFEFNTSYQPTKVIVKPNGLEEIEMLSLLYENGKLIAVYNNASKYSVIFEYTNGNLSMVRYCYGNDNTTEQNIRDAYADFENAVNVESYASARYNFNLDGYISGVEDIEAKKYTWYLTAGGKTVHITEYSDNFHGQEVSYTYGEGYTDVRSVGNDENLDTADDIITRYIFDQHNRAVSVYSMSPDGSVIYGATTGVYQDDQSLKNNLKGSTVLQGLDPDDVIDSVSGGEYFATINADDTIGTYEQTVFLEEDVASLTESNANMEYIISGFGYSNSVLQNESTDFSLGVNVYYYQGAGIDDVVVSYSFDFADVENIWQYVCGKFSCNLGDSPTYQYVHKIEVVCSYYGHPDTENATAYAYFKDIALTSHKASSGYNYYYDELGNLVRIENSLYWENYGYDDNRLISLTNSYGEAYAYTYTENDGTSAYSETYSKNGTLLSKTVYTYDQYGLLTSVSYSGGIDDNGSYVETYETLYITTAYEYITDPDSKIFGALLSETDSLGYKTVYEYDESNGELLYVYDNKSKSGYKYEYYDDGQLSSVKPIIKFVTNITEGAESVCYDYYEDGQIQSIVTESTTYHIDRNPHGNATEITAGDHSLATYEYYPNNGKLKKINYGNGFSEEYVYNTLEMLAQVWYTYDDGTSEQAFSYEYTPGGKLDVVTNLLEGKNTKYDYDNNGRLIGVHEKGTGEVEYSPVYVIEYDADGKVISHTPTIRYSTSESTISREFRTTYDYNGNDYDTDNYKLIGKLTSETLEYLSANHKIIYYYDHLNRIDNISRDFGSFDYSSIYSYVTDEINTSYRVASVNNLISGDYGSINNFYQYTYDSKGNITRVIYNTNTITDYEYDDLGQLVEAAEGNTTYEYAYDAAGNITTITETTLNENAGIVPRPFIVTDPLLPPQFPLYITETTTLKYTDSEWGDLLTSYNGLSIIYDEIGNPLTYYNGSLYTFTWEGRKLATAANGSKTMSFTYNDEGIRTSKTVNDVTHTYILNGSQILAEEWGDKLLVYLYDASGSPIGMMYRTTSYDIQNWDVFWYEKNLQGDIVAVYSSYGLKLVTYTYDAWGNQTVKYWNGGGSTAAQYNPFRYRGYYYDTDLRMYYLQSRYYDAKICRFINADVYISTGYGVLGYNMFAYCNNNPVCYSDHEGTDISYECLGEEDDYNPNNDWRYEGGGSVGGNPNGASSTGANTNAGSSANSNYYVGGNSNTGVCFVEGTIVKTSEGDVPIETIQVGDYVYAHNPETGETELKPVVDTFVNEATELVHVFTDGEEIICTNEHPFYSPVKGWTEACMLRTGDILVSLNGEYVVVEQVQHEMLEAPIKVYNFEVEDFHTYFVGDGDGVLVHNSCNHNSSWNSERINYWKTQAGTSAVGHNYGSYFATEANIARMSKGLAPIGWDGYSVQLHHPNGIANDFYNYYPVSRTFHNYLHSKN